MVLKLVDMNMSEALVHDHKIMDSLIGKTATQRVIKVKYV